VWRRGYVAERQTTRSIFGGSSLSLSGEVLHTGTSKSFPDFRFSFNNARFKIFFARRLWHEDTTTYHLGSRFLPWTRKRAFENWTTILSDGVTRLFPRIIGPSDPPRRYQVIVHSRFDGGPALRKLAFGKG
jgi:hypothetical protein